MVPLRAGFSIMVESVIGGRAIVVSSGSDDRADVGGRLPALPIGRRGAWESLLEPSLVKFFEGAIAESMDSFERGPLDGA